MYRFKKATSFCFSSGNNQVHEKSTDIIRVVQILLTISTVASTFDPVKTKPFNSPDELNLNMQSDFFSIVHSF